MSDQDTSVFSEQPQQETPAQETVSPQQEASQAASSAPDELKQQPSASSDNVFADQLASIKNERGEPKYKDLPTALEALKHSQEYIPQVKQENETLKQELERIKAELEQRGELEATIERLTAKREQPSDQPQSQGVTEEQLRDLLEQQLTQRDAKQKAQSNAQQVEQAIKQKYGEKTRDVVAAKAQEYGMTPTELGELAARSPNAALALFDVKPSPQGKQSYTSSSVSIPPVAPNTKPSLERPEKSLLSGATSKEQMEFMKRIKEETYERLGIDS